jgi:NADPH:quinone reductase-like Zn-dependent oxidoreductase
MRKATMRAISQDVLGWDVSGVVEPTGFGVTLFKPGDEVQPGQRVLIHAAAGGVGHVAVQIAKSLARRCSAPLARAAMRSCAAWGAGSVVRLGQDGRLAGETSFQPGAEPHGLALAADGTPWVALKAGFLAHLVP